ncbi:MAG: autotransporter outer membrane beta-barrel domain-containing protein [Bacteroidetes bacterium]|nr:autotransporter outer membrane beta-barrel domain-containing protein [Bacteroidota bacterium]
MCSELMPCEENVCIGAFIGDSDDDSVSCEVTMKIETDCNQFFDGQFNGVTMFVRSDPAFPEDEEVEDVTSLSISNVIPVPDSSFDGDINADWIQGVSLTNVICNGVFATFESSFEGACPGTISGQLNLAPENEIAIVNGVGLDCKGPYTFFTDPRAPLIREGTSGNAVQGLGSANPQAGCALVDNNQSASSSSFLIYLLIPAFIFIRRKGKKLKAAGKLVKQIRRFSSVLLFLALLMFGISFIGTMTASAQTILKNCSNVNRSLAESLDIACSELKSMEGSLNDVQQAFLAKCQRIIDGDFNVCQELDQNITSTSEVVSTLLSIQTQKQFKNIRSRLANVRAGGGSTISLGGEAFRNVDNETRPLYAANTNMDTISLGTLSLFNQAPGEGTSAFSKIGVFLNGSFTFGDRDNTNPSGLSSNGYDFDIFEIIAGLDYRFTNYLILGLSLNYSYTDADFTRSNGSVTSNSYYGTLYGSAFWDAFYVDALLSLGGANYDIERAVSGSLQKGDPSGVLYRLALAIGYDIYLNSFSISPYGRISYSQNNIGSYTENTVSDGSDDAAFALKFNSQDVKSFSTALGTQVAYAWSTGWGVVRPEALFEWIHEFEDSPDTVIATYAATQGLPNDDQVGRTGKPAGIDGDYFNLGGGVSALFPKGFSLFVYYERTLWYDNLNANYVTGGIRKEF